ncbi:hypothetical protein [Anaerospora hongkongensis]|uniref:hypothetical protein n=1 Tax=Anaerospora hongkongensis TaxID=244830 RepID=UPI00289FAE96|nr:hypothetical protein [Anaerospora hongkongensis]
MNVIVPKEYLQDIDSVFSVIEDIAVTNSLMRPGDMKLNKAKKLGIGEAPVTLFVASSVIVWFTKKWADTYLWPEIQKKIDSPSKAIIDWLVRIIEKHKGE